MLVVCSIVLSQSVRAAGAHTVFSLDIKGRGISIVASYHRNESGNRATVYEAT